MIVEFAPSDADIVWYDGKGFFRHPEEQAKAAQSYQFLDSDIITYISPFYRANGLVMDRAFPIYAAAGSYKSGFGRGPTGYAAVRLASLERKRK